MSEAIAVRYSHEVIADNGAIACHVDELYGRACRVIAYGGDHAVQAPAVPYARVLPPTYALALCRVEPENNPAMILEGFASHAAMPLVFIGNWSNSAFGRDLRQRYADIPSLHELERLYHAPIF